MIADPDSVWRVIEGIIVVATGLAMGSFVTALIYRLPRRIPFSHDPATGKPVRSICPPCGRVLTWRELIPVLSWAAQNGRCQCGKVKIPARYPLIELAVLALTLALWAVQGMDLFETPRYVALPFAAAVAWLAWHNQGWPVSIDYILIVCAVLNSFVSILFYNIGFIGLFHVVFAAALLAHGQRIPQRIQHKLLPGVLVGYLVALLII